MANETSYTDLQKSVGAFKSPLQKRRTSLGYSATVTLENGIYDDANRRTTSAEF
jgi:hypothetical protein